MNASSGFVQSHLCVDQTCRCAGGSGQSVSASLTNGARRTADWHSRLQK